MSTTNSTQRSKNTPEEVALVARAWAEGKKLQHFYLGEWKDRAAQDAELDLGTVLYRVKPEPRTFEFWLNPKGGILGHVNEVSEKNYIEAGWTKIKAKEIV